MEDDGAGLDVQATEPVDTGVPSGESTGDTSGNPAWNDVLSALPESLHGIVTPHLKKWDDGVNKRFETVQSQYKPYQSFVDNKIDPQQLESSLALAHMIDADPRGFYDKMTEFYKDQWADSGQGQETEEEEYSFGEEEQPQFNPESNPYIKQLKDQQDVIANFLSSQVEQENRQKAESEIDSELTAIGQKYGEIPRQSPAEQTIIALALQTGKTLTQAADYYFTNVAPKQEAPASHLPRVVNPGGGVPAQGIDPRKLNSEDTRNLVKNILAQAHQED